MTSMDESKLPARRVFGEVGKNWGWLFAFGILSFLLGMWGLGMAVFVTLASMIFYGIMLLVDGGAQLVQWFKTTGWNGRWWHLLISLAYILAGIVVIRNPALASSVFTLILAFVIMAVGVMRSIMAWQLRETREWFWVMVGGIAAIVLGVMILTRWPASSLVVIGLFISIELIMNGWAAIAVALAARGVAKRGS
ncbi:MAG: HdeD family acid-resistance protein [Candidatus Latescibacterota bacterium]|nr:MAG: HdeD family acid-resistance protein [Candidatus Latescibacterota bacterium]